VHTAITEQRTNHIAQHISCSSIFTTYQACITQAGILRPLFHTFQLTLLHTAVSSSRHLAPKQASRLLKIFLGTRRCSYASLSLPVCVSSCMWPPLYPSVSPCVHGRMPTDRTDQRHHSATEAKAAKWARSARGRVSSRTEVETRN
jgi:hypothetical protein